MKNIADQLNVKTVTHPYGKTIWITPVPFHVRKNEKYGHHYSDGPWSILVTEKGLYLDDDSHINPTDFRIEQFRFAIDLANEIWLEEFFNPTRRPYSVN
jgi:hypothetical protein